MRRLSEIELYELIIESINEGVCIIDPDKKILFVNQKMTEITGFSKIELVGKSVFDFMEAGKNKEVDEGVDRRKQGIKEVNEYQLTTKDKKIKWVSLNSQPLIHEERFLGVLTTITDISEQKRNTQLLEENYRHYASLFENSPIPIWDEDFSQIKKELDFLIESGVNDIRKYFEDNPDKLEQIFEKLVVNNINLSVVAINEAKSKQEVLENFKSLVTTDSINYALIQLEAISKGETSCEFDAELKTFKGNKRYVHLKWTVVKGYENDYSRVYLTTTDLTDRIKEENLALQKSNREKAILLKEVHHRVKNNLQIISSLLKLQSNTIDNQQVQEIFEVSLNRIYSMAKVHELLYNSAELSEINYHDYLESLINSLISTMSRESLALKVDLNVDEIKININTAIPLGLLINEILTNSFKHAFHNRESGHIYINIAKLNEDRFLLSIGDDGKGFHEMINGTNGSESLGLFLMDSLTEQLYGNFVRTNQLPGTHYELEFSMMR